jgi:kynurenine formamidase
MPVYEGAAYGEVLPFTNSSVRFVEYMHYEHHGMRRPLLKLDRETGSSLITSISSSPWSKRRLVPNPRYTLPLSEIPTEWLVMRDTTILDVRVEAGHEITPEEIDKAVAEADYRPGDEVLLRTGWGSTERHYRMGNDYYFQTPALRYDAGVRMAEHMDRMGSRVFMTDVGLVNPPRVQGHNWFTGDTVLVPLPKPWPSAEARERWVELGGKTHASDEPSSFGAIITVAVAICKCLVDCDQITSRRVKTIVLPLLIEDGGAFTARVFAIEE